MINKGLLLKILSENSWGMYHKSNPLEEFPTNVGIMYKINEIDVDKLVEEYNSSLGTPEQE